jgi:AcrR family transcriptional regulator
VAGNFLPRPDAYSARVAGRGRPWKFTLDEVVDAALALVEEHGGQDLSMPALARRLGTGSGTLYNYVGSRDELLDLVLGRALADLPPVPHVPGEDWSEALVGYLVATFRASVTRPGVMKLWFQRPHVHLGAAARAQAELALLESLGFSPQRATEVYWMLGSQLIGHVAIAASMADRPTPAAARSGSRLGRAQRHLDRLGQVSLYERAVRTVVSSLVTELAKQGAGGTA